MISYIHFESLAIFSSAKNESSNLATTFTIFDTWFSMTSDDYKIRNTSD